MGSPAPRDHSHAMRRLSPRSRVRITRRCNRGRACYRKVCRSPQRANVRGVRTTRCKLKATFIPVRGCSLSLECGSRVCAHCVLECGKRTSGVTAGATPVGSVCLSARAARAQA
eukprot:3200973-Pleurochrysis_carterae.AAC.1